MMRRMSLFSSVCKRTDSRPSVVPLSGSMAISATGMNGAVAGLSQVAGVSQRFRSALNVDAGALGWVCGAGGAGAVGCAASTVESESDHTGVASRTASTLETSFDANTLCHGYLGLWIRARRMLKTFFGESQASERMGRWRRRLTYTRNVAVPVS